MKDQTLKRLDDFFLKEEHCTYQEFCNLYNEGKPFVNPPSFIEVPTEIVFLLMDINLPKQLTDFLKDAKDAFIKNYFDWNTKNNLWESSRTKATKEMFNGADASEVLSYAFNWEESPEGYDFWDKMNDDWKIFIGETTKNGHPRKKA